MRGIYMRIVLILICLCSCNTKNSAPSQTPLQTSAQPQYTEIVSSDKLREDLDFLFKTIEEVHVNMYAYVNKEDFDLRREQLYRDINHPMSGLEFYKLVAPVVASLKNGHTYVHPPGKAFGEYVQKGGKRIPLVLHWNGTSVILKSYVNPINMPVGGEVLTIENQNAKEFLTKLARYLPSENKAYNLGFLERKDVLSMFLWLDMGEAESLKLRIKNTKGTVEEYNITSLSKMEIESEIENNKSKYETMSSHEGKSARYTYRFIPDYNTGLIEFNSFRDLEKFRAFLNETFKELKEHNVSSLIIDVRSNPGGSSSLGDEFLKYLTDKPFLQFERVDIKISTQLCKVQKWIKRRYFFARKGSIKSMKGQLIQPGKNPLRFSGQIFVLIGRRTASSAVSFAQAIKHFDIGTLVGQETVDTPVNYGDCPSFALPHSGLSFSVAAKRFVCAGGKPDGRGVLPDYEVEQKPQDSAKGVDTVLQFTLNMIRKGENVSDMKMVN